MAKKRTSTPVPAPPSLPPGQAVGARLTPFFLLVFLSVTGQLHAVFLEACASVRSRRAVSTRNCTALFSMTGVVNP